MEKAVSAADANRNFSQLLQGVRRGRSYVVTSHGKPLARLTPVDLDKKIANKRTRESSRQIATATGWQSRPLDARRTLRGHAVRVALDTNVLAYAEGVNGAAMRTRALDIVDRLPQASIVVPVQVLGELFQVLVRKAGRSSIEARTAILSWRNAFSVQETSEAILLAATDLSANHKVGLWDAVILCAAAEADCHLLVSEDMQDGFIWQGVTIANPFATAKHPLLNDLLERP